MHIHPDTLRAIEDACIAELRHQLRGLRAKVLNDFSEASFRKELVSLQSDPIYPRFAFDTPEYVLIRLMGRVSISIGRRLGEIYDKVLRLLTAKRFDIDPSQVAPKIKNLELDIGIRYDLLGKDDLAVVSEAVAAYAPDAQGKLGVGIEVRYNFNPNDSARLRKDVDMAAYVKSEGLVPIYLVFCSTSPRQEAMARLQRSGWTFMVGQKAADFSKSLFGMDITTVLDRPEIKEEIHKEVNAIMDSLFTSFAFQEAIRLSTEARGQR